MAAACSISHYSCHSHFLPLYHPSHCYIVTCAFCPTHLSSVFLLFWLKEDIEVVGWSTYQPWTLVYPWMSPYLLPGSPTSWLGPWQNGYLTVSQPQTLLVPFSFTLVASYACCPECLVWLIWHCLLAGPHDILWTPVRATFGVVIVVVNGMVDPSVTGGMPVAVALEDSPS